MKVYECTYKPNCVGWGPVIYAHWALKITITSCSFSMCFLVFFLSIQITLRFHFFINPLLLSARKVAPKRMMHWVSNNSDLICSIFDQLWRATLSCLSCDFLRRKPLQRLAQLRVTQQRKVLSQSHDAHIIWLARLRALAVETFVGHDAHLDSIDSCYSPVLCSANSISDISTINSAVCLLLLG